MGDSIKVIADIILRNSVGRAGGAPGVVAMATDSSDNFYEGAAGVRELGEANLMTTDSVMLLASCTNALVGTALMQLVEEGRVSLDDPAKEFTPEIANIQVLEGFKPDGEPILRKPKSDITLKELMLHTSGLGYDFFSEDLLKYRNLKEIPSLISFSTLFTSANLSLASTFDFVFKAICFSFFFCFSYHNTLAYHTPLRFLSDAITDSFS